MFLSQGENDMISKVFKNIELFNKLSDSDIKKLQKIGKIKKYKKGDIIFNKNEIGKTFFIVKSGEVKIFTSVGRKNKILSLIGEKNFFGELALLGVKYRTASAVCEKDSELYVISAKEFQNFLFKHKDFMIKMLYIMAERLKRADEEIENLIFHNMFGRVTKFIYERYIQEKNEKIKINAELRDYQIYGYNWLTYIYENSFGGCLADDMGLGKTAQAISFYHVLKSVNPDIKLFVVAPKSTLKNAWANDMDKFFNLESNIYATDDVRAESIQYNKPVVINYEALSYMYREDSSKLPVLDSSYILVLDEATKIKNNKTDIFNAIAHLRGKAFTIAISGTPVENHLEEFYTILKVVQPNFMPKYEFSKLFVEYEEFNIGNKPVYRVVGHKNVRLFYNITSDFVLRRDKSIVNMPDKVIKNIVVPLTDEQQSLIEQVVNEARRTMDDEIAKIATLVLIKRISDHPRLVEMGDSKLAVKLHPNDYTSNKMLILKRLLAETPKPVVIFTEYEDMAQIICEELQNTYSVAMITGVMTSKQRNTILHDFKAGVYQVLVATDALAYGVNLQFANSLINFDIPWNPAKRAQRIDRIHRIGITEPKFIYDLVSEGVETHAYKLITEKLEIFAEAVEGKDSIFESSVLKQLSKDYFDTFGDDGW